MSSSCTKLAVQTNFAMATSNGEALEFFEDENNPQMLQALRDHPEMWPNDLPIHEAENLRAVWDSLDSQEDLAAALAALHRSLSITVWALSALPCVCEPSSAVPAPLFVSLAEAAVAAMRRHPAFHRLQLFGCNAIARIARAGSYVLGECVRIGAVECVLRVVSACHGSESLLLRESSCAALAVLCDSAPARDLVAEALWDVVSVTRMHTVQAFQVLGKLGRRGDLSVLRRLAQSVGVLCGLALSGRELCHVVVDAGLLSTLAASDSLAAEDAVQLCRAIVGLSLESEERCDAQRALCVDALAKVLRRFSDAHVVDEALEALFALTLRATAQSPSLRAALLQPSTQQYVVLASMALGLSSRARELCSHYWQFVAQKLDALQKSYDELLRAFYA
eukprot:m51a1_g8710 hypothetical protein (393) ;mRNA; f:120217-122788